MLVPLIGRNEFVSELTSIPGSSGYLKFTGNGGASQHVIAQTQLVLAKVNAFGPNNAYFCVSSDSTYNGPALTGISFGSTGQCQAWGDSTSAGGSPDAFGAVSAVNPAGIWFWYANTWNGGLNASDVLVYHWPFDAPPILPSQGSSFGAGSGSARGGTGSEFYIGNSSGLNRGCDADIALLARWNRVLTKNELEQAARGGPLTVPGVILCWANGRDYGPYGLLPSAQSGVTRKTAGMPWYAPALACTHNSALVAVIAGSAIVTTSAASRLRARSAETSAPTKAPTAATRAYARAADAGAPTKVSGAATRVVPHTAATPSHQVTASGATSTRARIVCASHRHIVIDAASATTSVSPTLSNYTILPDGTPRIFLWPRLTPCEGSNGWQQVVVKVTGVAGTRPIFRIDLTQAGNEVAWNSAQKGFFSTDGGVTWTKMGNAPTIDAGVSADCSHSADFTNDTVWFARYRVEGLATLTDWLTTLAAAYPALISDVAGGSSLIGDTYASQTDELSRTVASVPLYAFRVRDSSLQPLVGSKKIAALVFGVHASETKATTLGRAFVDYLCSSATAAQELRRAFDWVVIPYLNAMGREGGYYRAGPEIGTGNANDANRHFSDSPAPIESVEKPRTILLAEMADASALLLDWHCTVGTGDGIGYTAPANIAGGPSPGDWKFKTALIARCGSVGGTFQANPAMNASGDPYIDAWAWYSKRAYLAHTVEVSSVAATDDADMAPRAQAVALALADMVAVQAFGVDPATRLRARAADTVAPTRSISAASRGLARAVCTAAPTGVTVASCSSSLRSLTADSVTGIRTVSAASRAGARTVVAAAPTGVTVVSCSTRLRARSADSVSCTRAVSAASRARAWGAVVAAPSGVTVVSCASRLRSRSAAGAAVTKAATISTKPRARTGATAAVTRSTSAATSLRARGRCSAANGDAVPITIDAFTIKHRKRITVRNRRNR